MIDFRRLAKAGVHFGHQTSRWNPKMAPYIWGHKSGVHLIDVSKTAHQLEKASKFLESLAAEGKQILWVGTKKAAQDAIGTIGKTIHMPYVTHRWIGGTLTNSSQVRKSITRLLHFEDIISKAEQSPYTKKELNMYQKIVDRLLKSIGGIRTLRWPVGAVVLVDVRKEQTALKEARSMGIPVVALVDTNGDPSLVDYVIPANDDSPKSVQIVVQYLAEAAQKGIAAAAEKKLQAEGEQAAVTPRIAEEVARALQRSEEEETEESKAQKQKVAMKKPAPRRHTSSRSPR
jgi:small subunit ribosomal protein S2